MRVWWNWFFGSVVETSDTPEVNAILRVGGTLLAVTQTEDDVVFRVRNPCVIRRLVRRCVLRVWPTDLERIRRLARQ